MNVQVKTRENLVCLRICVKKTDFFKACTFVNDQYPETICIAGKYFINNHGQKDRYTFVINITVNKHTYE